MAATDKGPQEPQEIDPTTVNRFLAHQLTEIEAAQLEKQLAVNRETRVEVEATARLKVGLHKLRETGELDALLQQPPKSYRTTFSWAAAAIVLLGIAALAGRVASNDPALRLAASVEQLTGNAARVLPISRPYRLIRTRSAEGVVIDLPPTRQAIALRLFPQLDTQPPYSVAIAALQDDTRQQPASSSAPTLASTVVQAADADLFVTVFLDSAALEPGNYVLTIAGTNALDDSREQFSVRVRRAATP